MCVILAGVAAEAQTPWPAPDSVHAPPGACSTLVTIQAGSPTTKPPLFCVHAEAGEVSLYFGIARHLGGEQPLLGLCAPPELGAHWSLEQLAARHVQSIRRARPTGPYLILGECTGGALAYEIAQQLRAAGQQVALLALVDSFAPGQPQLRRFMPRALYRVAHRVRILGFHLHNLARLDVNDKFAYVAAKLERARLKIAARRNRLAAGASPQLSFRSALAAYTPKPWTDSMLLIRAARLPLGIQAAPDMGWGALVERLQLETVPGYFTTPISEPGVRILAERLARHLASAAPSS